MKALRARAATAALLSAALAAGVVVTTATPALANGENSLSVGKLGETHATFGPNATVTIWGSLVYKDEGCPEEGVPDFVYAASDVYIVAPGAGEGHLVDVTGSPNTVIQYQSVFADEVIGITAPAGKLGAGDYDVVFDTCQDGVFDAADDTVFPRAITVALPQQLPPADAALTSVKQAAYEEYLTWKLAKRIMDWVWKLQAKAVKGSCKAGSLVACALKQGKFYSSVQEGFAGLLLNEGQHWLAIYEDPPNPDFAAPVVAGPVAADGEPIAGETALLDALLRAIEAYKGAQAAGDRGWALVHAREVRDLHRALANQLAATASEFAALKALAEADADGLQDARTLARRVHDQGLNAAERKALREAGLTSAEITALETEMGTADAAGFTVADLVGALAEVSASHTRTIADLQTGYDEWSSIVDSLAGGDYPLADAGGPYSATEGSVVTLDAGRSTAGDLAWDLDGDRDFDDATGAKPAVTFDQPGAPVIGVRLTTGDGRVSYSWAAVSVSRSGPDPSITSATPDPVQSVLVGSQTVFTVATAASVAWSVDGQPAGEGAGLTWNAPDTPGSHEIVATATDGAGHRATRAWDVTVLRPDSDADGWTATTDCVDSDAAVNPGRLEVLGNGIDDDCDAGSPDAPPGGATGTAFASGHNTFGETAVGDNKVVSSARQTVLPDSAVEVELGFRFGLARLGDGTVLSYGYNLDGTLGDGTSATQRYTPAPVLDLDGEGPLQAVSISATDMNGGAVRSDGTVAVWGSNRNRQLGDGSTVSYRNTPVTVLSGPGSPLQGVRDLSAAVRGFYALMNDGTVTAWGVVKCLGGTGPVTQPYATPVPGLTDIRAISAAGDAIFFLRKDGTLLSCGSGEDNLGRPATNPNSPASVTGLGRGSGVVEVDAAGDTVAALKADGTVLMWGQNTNHALDVIGLAGGGATRVPTAVPLPPGAPVVTIAHEESANTFVVRADGSMLGWGSNQDGAVGLGTVTPVSVPTVVAIPGRIVLQAETSPWHSMWLTRPAEDPQVELPARWVTASVADAQLSEEDGGAFTVTLDHALGDDVALTWSLLAGSAGEDDATLGTGTVVVPRGETTATIPVQVADDAIDEDDETVTLALTGARLGLTLGRTNATGTIADNDEAPTVTVTSVTVTEGATSLTDTAVTFQLSAPSGKQVVVAFQTRDAGATAGQDYVAATATIRFEPGETTDVVHLGVIGDTVLEADESFTVALREVTNGVAGDPGTVTIADDETMIVSVVAPTLVEGASGDFVISVDPAPPAGVSVSVPWSVEGEDIVAASGTATLTAERPSVTVTVTTVDDSTVEAPEPVALTLGELTASDGHPVLRGVRGTGWINDNDTAEEPEEPTTWPWDGFKAPVENPPAVNKVKAGQAIPLKFSLGGDRGLDIFAAGSPSSAKADCGTATVVDLTATANPGDSTLHYDAVTDTYNYVWKTDKAWAGHCRVLVMTLADGTQHTALFTFK